MIESPSLPERRHQVSNLGNTYEVVPQHMFSSEEEFLSAVGSAIEVLSRSAPDKLSDLRIFVIPNPDNLLSSGALQSGRDILCAAP